jgi:hypothetical protein
MSEIKDRSEKSPSEGESVALRHKLDETHANAVKHIVEDPLDIPSLERQLWHSDYLGDEPFLSAGYTWKDKPHRVLHEAR